MSQPILFSRAWRRRTVVLLASVVLALAATAPVLAQSTSSAASSSTAVPFVDSQGLDLAEKRVIAVYNEVAPSVVNITTQVLQPSFFYGSVPAEGAASGFVIDTAGHILTNYHVIQNAQRINVAFGNGTSVQAKLVGSDARNDIAVLKVDAPKSLLKPVTFGDSNHLQVGQRAIAIGNPFGEFGRTLTTGVVSALDRSIQGPSGLPITGIIQTDAAINKGNSGGPLLDSAGRVIGITSAIFSPSGTNAGVGFALPIATVKRVLPSLLKNGSYPHPYLGVKYAHTLTPGLARALGLQTDHGLLLVQLVSGSPLDQAGLKGASQQEVVGNRLFYVGGDVLLKVDDHTVRDLGHLKAYLEDHFRVGDSVTVTYLRGGTQQQATVTLAREPQ
ncbi:MAG: trypsin-like peptidase domain-containing protein [Deinococcales bacterium]